MINTPTIFTNDYSLLQINYPPLVDEALVVFELDSEKIVNPETLKTFHNTLLLKNEHINFSFFIPIADSWVKVYPISPEKITEKFF